jgi:hypothetical protein
MKAHYRRTAPDISEPVAIPAPHRKSMARASVVAGNSTRTAMRCKSETPA